MLGITSLCVCERGSSSLNWARHVSLLCAHSEKTLLHVLCVVHTASSRADWIVEKLHVTSALLDQGGGTGLPRKVFNVTFEDMRILCHRKSREP